MSYADRISSAVSRVSDMARKFVVTAASEALIWAVEGFSDDEDIEVDKQQVYQHYGFLSRPEDGSNTEAISVAINANDQHVIIACRDDAAVRRVVSALGLDGGTVHVYNAHHAVSVTADAIEAKSLEGTAAEVAFKSDVDNVNARVAAVESSLNALIVKYNGHTQAVSGAAAGAPVLFQATPSSSSATVNGTAVFKAE